MIIRLHHIIPKEALRILAKHGFRLVGPWREYYQLGGNALLIRELPLKITFRGRDRDVVSELRPFASRVIESKNRVSMKLKESRHLIVVEFEG